MHHLVEDVQAVMYHLKRDKANIIGHDWGGAIAWIFAIILPALTERLIILNCPHPTGITRELAHNPQQQEQSAYARDFQQEDAHKRLSPESLSVWVKDSRERYLEAFRCSDFEAMLHLQTKLSTSTVPGSIFAGQSASTHSPNSRHARPVSVTCRLEQYLGVAGERLDLAHIRHAGHFVQHDAVELVTGTIVNWFTR